MRTGRDLVDQLLALAATVMEDASATALIDTGQPLEERIAAVLQAGRDTVALACAAEVVRLRSDDAR